MRTEPTPLAAILTERIRACGPITFAEYMEACLYHPEHGYYTKADQQTRRDYFTSVDLSPLFGRLLARQFHEMWWQLDRPEPFTLVEAGAGTGVLARHVLDFTSESLKDFYAALRYVTVERSAPRRAAQSGFLERHVAGGRLVVSEEMPKQIACGCIFSNEFFDAMPVHRVARERGELREWYVAAGVEGFHEQAGHLSTPALGEYFTEQGVVLEEQQQAEACLEACKWSEQAARKIERGFVLTIDYGHLARELYDRRHMRGTLLAYACHRASEDYFRAPGEQDLTAHVNFTALERWGARGGLTGAGFTTQTNFLLALARRTEFEDLRSGGMNENEQARARLLFKTLIYPEGMGETFQVLAQRKGIESSCLAGFDPL